MGWVSTVWAAFSCLSPSTSLVQAVSCVLADNELSAHWTPVWPEKYLSPHYALTPHWGLAWTSTHWIDKPTHTCRYQVKCAWPGSRLFTEAQDPIATKWNKLLMLVFMNHWCTSTFLFPKLGGIKRRRVEVILTMQPGESECGLLIPYLIYLERLKPSQLE